MTFISYQFALFFFAAYLAYCAATLWFPGTGGGRRAVLFLASAAFLFLAGGPRSLCCFALSAATVWGGALSIERMGAARKKRRIAVFAAVLSLLFGILAITKYLNFPGYTMEELAWLRGKEYIWEPLVIAEPLAISYYTLTLAGYLIDVMRGEIHAEKSLPRFLLFGGFFPQMSAGPIARYSRLSATLFKEKASLWEDFWKGGGIFLWGLFKKLIIAERVAVLVNSVYSDPDYFSGAYLVFAALCFPVQLYTDFSGAADMAVGLARIFGVQLEHNFRQPFASRSIAEFWRRWHITLGSWCRDYIYIPLGGNRKGKLCQIRNLLLVWMFTGLWHGGKWTFLIGVGFWQALLMCIGVLTQRAKGKAQSHALPAILQRARTYVLIAIGFVFFRADSLAMAAGIFRGMTSGCMDLFSKEGFLELGLGIPDTVILAGSLMLLWAVPHTAKRGRSDVKMPVLCLGLAFAVLIFGFYGQGYDASAFIYSQF